MKQKTRFKNFGNIGRYISPWMANISVLASKKPYRSISSYYFRFYSFQMFWNIVRNVLISFYIMHLKH